MRMVAEQLGGNKASHVHHGDAHRVTGLKAESEIQGGLDGSHVALQGKVAEAPVKIL